MKNRWDERHSVGIYRGRLLSWLLEGATVEKPMMPWAAAYRACGWIWAISAHMAWGETLQANLVVTRPLETGIHVHCPQLLAGIRFVGASTAKTLFLLLRWRIREGRQIGLEGRLAVTGSLAWEMLVLVRHL
ncbi:MAG: hypothetical protein AAGJ80_05415, partial [Cyanobacteria bacterium J06553_1]